jgi:hypothetical protein
MDKTRSITLTPEELAGAERFVQWMKEEDKRMKNYIEPVIKKEAKNIRLPKIEKELQLRLF